MTSFGDGIDWSAEARRAAAVDAARGGIAPIGRSDIVDTLLELLPNRGRVLDAGSNIGRYCPLILANGFGYVGVDQSEEAIRIARERNPKGKFVHSFLWDMQFDEPFDAAISLAVLQHNQFSEKVRIIPHIAAALRPGGVFVMMESTVEVATATQMTRFDWIDTVSDCGFELIKTFHPNPEGIDDAYAFRRVAG